MIRRWLGLHDRRSRWIFSLAVLCILACLLMAALGPTVRRMDFLLLAGVSGGIGSGVLDRSSRSYSKTLAEIYQERLRSVIRMSFASKLLSLLCIGLIVIAFVTQVGR